MDDEKYEDRCRLYQFGGLLTMHDKVPRWRRALRFLLGRHEACGGKMHPVFPVYGRDVHQCEQCHGYVVEGGVPILPSDFAYQIAGLTPGHYTCPNIAEANSPTWRSDLARCVETEWDEFIADLDFSRAPSNGNMRIIFTSRGEKL